MKPRLSPALYTSLALIVGLTLTACIEIPGLEPGDPCNSQNICVEGLRCIAGTCEKPGEGVGWRQMDTPRSATFYALWGPSEQEAYAVGSSGAVVRYQSGAWQELPSGTTRTLYAVIGHKSDVWVGGSSGALRRYDGSTFHEATVEDTQGQPLKGVSVRGFAEVGGKLYAVSSDSSSKNRVLELQSGDRWRQVGEVTGFSMRAMIAVGRELLIAGSGTSSVTRFDLDNKSATQLLLPGGSNYGVNALHGTSLDGLVVAGDNIALQRKGDGSWEPLKAMAGLHGEREYRGLWGSGLASELYLVGDAVRPGGNYSTPPSGIESCRAGSCAFDQLLVSDGSGGFEPLTSSKKIHAVWGKGALRLAAGEGGIYRRQ